MRYTIPTFSGTVAFRIEPQSYGVLCDFNQFVVCVDSNRELVIKHGYVEPEIKTGIYMNTNAWNTLCIAYDRLIAGDSATESTYAIKLWCDFDKCPVEIAISNLGDFHTFIIGGSRYWVNEIKGQAYESYVS